MADVSALWRSHRDQRKPDSVPPSDAHEEPAQLRTISRVNVHVYDMVVNWPRTSEKLLFGLGFGSQVTAAFASAVIISKIVRKRFYVSGLVSGLMSAYGASAFASAFILGANDYITVQNLFHTDQTKPTCIICIQTKQALANLGAAVLVPSIMVIPDTLYHAGRDPNYGGEVPKFGRWKRTWKFVAEKYKGTIIRSIGWIAVANVIIAYTGTYLQFEAVDRMLTLIEDDPTLIRKSEKRESTFTRILGRIKNV